jgi:hypothetical protein
MSDFGVGVNLPWLDYGQDFGASAWRPQGGVAQPDRRQRMREALDRVAQTGARLVRWWLLGDGRAGLQETAAGPGVRHDERLLDDVEAAVDALRQAGLQVIFVVTDFLWFAPSRIVDGVQTGGRRYLVRDDALRRELMESVFAPIAERWGGEPAVAAWDLCNEPEWATLGLGTLDPRRALSRGQMRAFLRDLVSTFRSRARQPLTVGLASARWLGFVEGLGLDLYQVHWYESLDPVATLARPVAARGLDRPLLLGEFPTRGASLPPAAIVEKAAAAGYSGALAWSLLAGDRATDGLACAEALLECNAPAGGPPAGFPERA